MYSFTIASTVVAPTGKPPTHYTAIGEYHVPDAGDGSDVVGVGVAAGDTLGAAGNGRLIGITADNRMKALVAITKLLR